MIDKATFEALVRAEAEKRYPLGESYIHPIAGWTKDIPKERLGYIAARMEQEWKLVEAFIKYARHRVSCPVREWERGPAIAPLTYAPGRYVDACNCGLTAALSPYTTKDIEP